MSFAALLDGLRIPIVQAPMLGAAAEPLAVAVGKTGGMGTLAAGAMSPDEIVAAAAGMKSLTDAPFGINLLITSPVAPEARAVDAAIGRLAPWYAELGEPAPEAPNAFAPDFRAQLAAVVRAAPAVASFTFGCLAASDVATLRAAGTYVVGTATTVAEARAWADAGADGICAQGFEAGGHRGHFLADPEASLVGTLTLVGAIRAAVDLPVIAAGGIMDGRGVAASLALGAAAAQMGTAFLLADEAATSPPWRRALEAAPDDATRLTRAFTGRHARGLENRFMREMRAVQDEVPAYPVQNRLTQALRAAATRAGAADMMSLWAGQGVGQARPGPARDLIERWWAEAGEVAAGVAARTRRGRDD